MIPHVGEGEKEAEEGEQSEEKHSLLRNPRFVYFLVPWSECLMFQWRGIASVCAWEMFLLYLYRCFGVHVSVFDLHASYSHFFR